MEEKIEPLLVPQPHKDRISELPADILVNNILSRLPFKEAVQSSILSHRWMNLWTYVPRLHFEPTKDERLYRPRKEMQKQMAVFANRVNHVLALHKSFNILEFRISFELDKGHQNDIDKWLEYAFTRGVERLDLNFYNGPISGVPNSDCYIFPNRFLENTTRSFSHVRVLCFTAVTISGEAIEGLLRKCPLLEDLRVIGSRKFGSLVVSGPSIMLKHLHIIGCFCVKSITISNTNIVSLSVPDHGENGDLMLNHLPMLSELWINGNFSDKSVFFSRLTCCHSQLTVLTLKTTSPEILMRLYKLPELKNLRRLLLVTITCSPNSLLGLTSLIESCPRLVEFALIVRPRILEVFRDAFEMEQVIATEETLKGLKVFELYGYQGRNTNEIELIKLFIEKAIDLEKIVIDPRDWTNYFEKPIETYRVKESIRHAMENVKGLVPQHVDFVLL